MAPDPQPQLKPRQPRRQERARESYDSLSFFHQNSLGRLEHHADAPPAAALHPSAAGSTPALAALPDMLDTLLQAKAAGQAASGAAAMVKRGGAVRGRRIMLRILSTWGDRHYVGLSGVELYDEQGELLVLDDPRAQVHVEPRLDTLVQSSSVWPPPTSARSRIPV